MKHIPSSTSTRMPPTGGAINGGGQPANIVQPAIRSDNTSRTGIQSKLR